MTTEGEAVTRPMADPPQPGEPVRHDRLEVLGASHRVAYDPAQARRAAARA